MIKAIFLDWGNTFAGDFKKANKEIAELVASFDLDPKTFGLAFRKFYLLRSSGEIKDDAELEEQLQKHFQKEIPVKKIIDIFTNKQEVPQENIEIVKELKKKYKVGILSNNIYEWLEGSIKSNGIENLFDSLMVSSKVGVRKPDVAIYLAALEELSVMPAESVFVADEVAEDLVMASGLGMKTIWLNQKSEAWAQNDDSQVLKFYKPDEIINSFKDLPEAIELLENN